jgi:hypothetical protein
MTTLGFAAVSIFRREKGQIGAVIVLVLTGGLFLLSEMGSGTAFKTTETQGEAYDGAGCTTDKIEIKDFKWDFRNRHSTVGVATLINHCQIPIGVQTKLTARDSSGNVVAVKDGSWPASVSNIPPGEYSFSIDTWLDYDPAIKTIEMSVSGVRQW